MRIGIFELREPLPVLQHPHAIAVLRPWIDAGNVGTLTITHLESLLIAQELGKIARPGMFYDFTRYRPVSRYRDGNREVIIPNTVITYTIQENGHDFVFLKMLEPQMFGELYTSSVVLLLKKLNIERYCLLGSMYDMVPHTRPLLISGGATNEKAKEQLEKVGLSSSNYEGPTTICTLISQELLKAGIETMTMLVRLPQYTELEEDYMGQVRLLEVLSSIYGIPVGDAIIHRAEKQLKEINTAVNRSRRVKEVVAQLETFYDTQLIAKREEKMPPLSPGVEDFLKEMEKRFKQG
jgi:predicted ATP-grasp superfamily ATP-dependent carboligase